MVLVVLTTLMISFIALFSQMVVNQTAQIYNSENAFMHNMVTWHGGALAVAHSSPPVFSAAGCRLTAKTVAGFPGACASTIGVAELPGGYNFTDFSFYSLAFLSSGANPGNYVLTFVCTTKTVSGTAAACTTDTNGFIELPGGAGSASTGFNPGDLMSQLKRAAPIDASYGSVTASGTFTQATSSTNIGYTAGVGYKTYTIPPSIPVGAVGIISIAN